MGEKGVLPVEEAGDGLKGYYEQRFSGGYMSYWSPLQRSRVRSVVGDLALSHSGSALDFGCGQGVMSEEVRRALPNDWTLLGTDLSDVALAQASSRWPDITFVPTLELLASKQQFDLVFTHHVLEHVSDLSGTLETIDQLVKPGGLLIHALPCGNADSLEWNLCQLVDGGIESDRGNRFFFEEDGHLRRLTSRELSSLLDELGYEVVQESFAGHEWSAIEWMSASHPRLISAITPIGRGKSLKAKVHLATFRSRLLALNALRMPAVLKRRVDASADVSRVGRVAARVSAVGLPVSKKIDSRLSQRALHEWETSRDNLSGSEMYLVFRKSSVTDTSRLHRESDHRVRS